MLGLWGLFIIYFILTPLTLYSVYYILDYQHGASLQSSGVSKICDMVTNLSNIEWLKSIACIKTTIFFKGYYATLVPACIAGAAIYLLLILNLTTRMDVKKRIKSLIFLIITFLIINIIRITLFANIYATKGFDFFEITHRATWYFGSTVLVVLLWLLNIFIFNIREIPIYSEIRSLIKKIKLLTS
jgi:exosortase/archaeosortase family protein